MPLKEIDQVYNSFNFKLNKMIFKNYFDILSLLRFYGKVGHPIYITKLTFLLLLLNII